MPEQDLQSLSNDEARRSRRALLLKAGLAGGAILVLIIALVVLDSSPDKTTAPRSARVVTPEVEPDTAAQSPSLAEATTQALRTSEEAAQIQSVVMAEQAGVSTPPAEKEETADPTATVLGVPAPAAKGKAEASGGRLVLAQSSARAARSSAPAARPAAPAASTPAAAASSASGFMVQVGVFANHGNAEELRGKLTAAGIPTQVETRVQIGPFPDRKSALVAQQKLKALGLDGGLIIPPHQK